MKKLFTAAFAASVLLAGPGTIVTAGSAFAQSQCGPDAPEAWRRPGGYCDFIGAGNSLSGPVDPGCTPLVDDVLNSLGLESLRKGEHIDVALACCEEVVSAPITPDMQIGDRLRMALVETTCGTLGE